MSTTTSVLDGIDVAKPCPADWATMTGDDKVRHCASCDLDVYDLSAMRRAEAEEFVASRTGKLRTCIRFYRRADGTVLTQDCPVGVRAAWRKMKWAAAGLLAAGFASAAMFAPRGANGVPRIAPLKQVYEFVQAHFGAPVAPAPMGGLRMGDFAPPPPASPPAPAPVTGTVRMGEANFVPPAPAK